MEMTAPKAVQIRRRGRSSRSMKGFKLLSKRRWTTRQSNWLRSQRIALREIREESFSGHLPRPDHWDRCGPERIVRMAEVPTTDESARRDRLVDAEFAEAPESRSAALAPVARCLLAAPMLKVPSTRRSWPARSLHCP